MSTKFALLGLLNIKKMSAYDLEKFAKETIGYFWNESYCRKQSNDCMAQRCNTQN